MDARPDYRMHMDVLCDFLEKVDVPRLVADCEDPWWNQTLCRVNDCVVRLGIIQGEFHWHQHAEEDEFFFVLEGRLLIDVRHPAGGEQTVALGVHEGYTVPKGVVHRTRAPEKVVMLMVERASVVPTGD
jgi:mannose-6-phosphate isomerase-like protein (cupin superfamily)